MSAVRTYNGTQMGDIISTSSRFFEKHHPGSWVENKWYDRGETLGMVVAASYDPDKRFIVVLWTVEPTFIKFRFAPIKGIRSRPMPAT